MNVRRATDADTEAMALVMATVAREGLLGTEAPVDVAARAERMRGQLADGSATMWVLEDEGTIVGNGGLHDTSAEGVLSLGVAILPGARGRGGGTALLTEMLGEAEARGAHKVELEVWPDNARAIALYERLGFECEGLRRDHYRRRDGSLRSSVLMGRLIDGR